MDGTFPALGIGGNSAYPSGPLQFLWGHEFIARLPRTTYLRSSTILKKIKWSLKAPDFEGRNSSILCRLMFFVFWAGFWLVSTHLMLSSEKYLILCSFFLWQPLQESIAFLVSCRLCYLACPSSCFVLNGNVSSCSSYLENLCKINITSAKTCYEPAKNIIQAWH